MGNILAPNWDDYFMTMVYLAASKSRDEHTHIGAVVVGPDSEIRSTGYNSFPRGLNDDVLERHCKEDGEKFYWFEHAERNAIYNASLIGVSLKGCMMYTNGIPCMDCARGVVQSGIVEVVVDKEWDAQNPEKWKEHGKRALEMFREVNVKIRYWEGKLLEIQKFRRGKIFPDGKT
ncbi:MAG TPA: deaminase [Candidatus Nanoarchaeia archaeon]|nr:deaminase [Candidatus Nanoarchaeia archaeon]